MLISEAADETKRNDDQPMRRFYDQESRRLIYLHQPANPEFWDANWNWQLPDRDVLLANRDSLWAKITSEFLQPADGSLLEGGCGMGLHVAALRNAGYRVIGVDFARNTVDVLNRIAPELDVRFGDVRQLAFDDNSFAGYWSLGVIEHFWDGYDQIAHEMYRVLRPGGVLFLAFPYMNSVRCWKSSLRIFPRWRGASVDNFYQFALNPQSVLRHFQALGFKLLEDRPVLGRQGLQEEAPAMARRIQQIVDGRSTSILARAWRRTVHEINVRLLPYFCYSMLFVLRK